MSEKEIPEWLGDLSDEDFQFIKRFILASGSLKDVAAEYGISYPTVRLRLDRLIEKVKLLDKAKDETPFKRLIRVLVADGALEHSIAKRILKEHEANR
jgi:hypothetical protein